MKLSDEAFVCVPFWWRLIWSLEIMCSSRKFLKIESQNVLVTSPHVNCSTAKLPNCVFEKPKSPQHALNSFPEKYGEEGREYNFLHFMKKNALSGWWWCKMHPKTTNEVHHHLLGEMWGNSEREKNVGEITFQGGIFPTMLPFSARIHLVRLFSKLQAGARSCMVCTVKSNSVSVRLMTTIR